MKIRFFINIKKETKERIHKNEIIEPKLMQVFIEKEQKEVELNFNGKVKDLLIKLQINGQTIIVIRNDEIITEEDTIENGDKIQLLSVVSGG